MQFRELAGNKGKNLAWKSWSSNQHPRVSWRLSYVVASENPPSQQLQGNPLLYYCELPSSQLRGERNTYKCLWVKHSNTETSFMNKEAQQMENQCWIMGGDFNLITSLVEKKGGRRTLEATNIVFKDFIQGRWLVDIETGNGWFTQNK